MDKINWNKFIAFFIFLYAFFSPLSLAGANVSLALALACWAVKSISGRRLEVRNTPVSKPLVFFVAAVGISVLFSTGFRHSLVNFDSMWVVCIFFLAVSNITDMEQFRKIIGFLIIMTVAVSIIGIIEHFTRINIFEGRGFAVNKWLGEPIPRASGTFSHPVKFGMYLMMIIPIILGSIISSGKGKLRPLFIIALIISLLVLLYTYSRGCWIALFIAMVFYGYLVLKPKVLIIVSTGVLAVVVVFMLLFPGVNFSKRMKTLTDLKNNTSNIHRIASWKACVRMARERPVFGFGWRRIKEENSKYVEVGVKPFNHAHSTYLNFLVETGIVGLGALLWLFVSIVVRGLRVFRSLNEGYLKIMSGGLLASVLAFMVSGLVDYPFSVPMVTELFYFFIGMLFAVPMIDKRIGGNNG